MITWIGWTRNGLLRLIKVLLKSRSAATSCIGIVFGLFVGVIGWRTSITSFDDDFGYDLGSYTE